jgi:MFS family permease
VVVRQYYGAAQAGWRIGLVNSFGLLGMALGGWLGGAIYDWALSYRPAFLVGLALNLVNLACIGALLRRPLARVGVPAATR